MSQPTSNCGIPVKASGMPQVEKVLMSDKGAFQDAHPYTVAALKRRREYGNDVPTWIDLTSSQAVLIA